MINPSGIRHQENDELQIREVRPGLFTVGNAYVGNYEYFDNRPIIMEPTKSSKLSRTDELNCRELMK